MTNERGRPLIRAIFGYAMVLVLAGAIPADFTRASGTDIEEAWYLYANSLYDRNDPGLFDFARKEYEDYLKAYPRGKYVDDVLFRIAKLSERNRRPDDALLYYMKLVYLYPDSLRSKSAEEDVRALADAVQDLRERRPIVLQAFTEAAVDAPPDARHRAYVRLLLRLDIEALYEPIVLEIREFLRRYPDYEGNASFQRELARTYERLERYPEAVAALDKVRFLYPESPLLAQSILDIGDLYQYNIKDEYQARKSYNQILAQFPTDAISGTALLRLAELEEKRLKRPSEAVRFLSELISRFPDHPEVVTAHFERARVLIDAFRDTKAAVASLVAVADRYPEHPRAPEALWQAAGTEERDRPAEAIRLLTRLADRFPRSRLASDGLLRAGKIAEKQGDPAEAIRQYQSLTGRFPGSDAARQAEKRLSKLQARTDETR